MVSQFYKGDLKYRVAIALHKYFEENQIFIKKPNTVASNKELLCIANILEFALINVGAIKSESKIKINNIRNYLQRKSLPSYFTYVPYSLNLTMLEKYFDKPFLSSVPINKTITTFSEPYIILERFNITHLLAEIWHIMECVKFYKSLIGNQFLENLETTLINESFISFSKFVKDITFENNNLKLASIQYKFLDASRDYQINERQPLLLIEKAITEYYERHPEEFNFDLIATSISSNKKDGHKIKYLNDFKIQSERFLPQFCNRMYKFLSNESKPALNESTPGNLNLIIACILIECSIFNDSLIDENIVVKKVERWISDVES